MSRGTGVGLVLVSSALVVALLVSLGALQVSIPALLPDVTDHRTEITYVETPTVVAIEPIALDCRVRVVAEVPVHGRREHKVFGKVYRTDTVDMLAVGDVDTCVRADAVQVNERPDGVTQVLVPAEAIVFHRPRVDAAATQDSVTFDKGFVGKLTDALPWVSDGEGLTPAAYAFAQHVVGSSDCMAAAYSVTEDLLAQAYLDQARAKGITGEVLVTVVGTPDFGQNEPAEPDGDFDLWVDLDGSRCRVAGDVDVPAEVTVVSDQS